MQFFKVRTDGNFDLDKEIRHIKFKDVPVNGSSGKESDLEELIVKYPGLLNVGDFSMGASMDADLLIISQQPLTANRKRADLFAIDNDGNLVIIEIKRDAVDERYRSEGMEFQAIRYAAASRKLTVEAIIEEFAKHLRKKSSTPAFSEENTGYWRKQAVDKLCDHLADEVNTPGESDLPSYINPKDKQKIYLVAADYEVDVTSACAWLREHQIDVSCFRLRPYQIGSEFVLERERLIPPPELDDFMNEMAPATAQTTQPKVPAGPRNKSNKPTQMVWIDDLENPITVTSWKGLVKQVIGAVLEHGVTVGQLPMKKALAANGEPPNFFSPELLTEQGYYVELHGSSDELRKHIQTMVSRIGKSGLLHVTTANGEIMEF